MHCALLTLVLVLSTSLTFSLGINGVRNTDLKAEVRSICDDTDGLCTNLVCSHTGISVTLDVDALKAKNIDIGHLHLRDRRCTGFPYNSETVNITWSLGENICGTVFTTTDTHGIYKNQVFLPPDIAGIIYRELYIINVTCSYPLHLNVSLPEVLRPDLSITYINIENIGQFKVKMAIYEDAGYTTQFTDPVVELSTKDDLFVRVYIVDPTIDYSLLMVNCFSTPTNNIYDPIKYDLIIKSCRNPADPTIKMIENGKSTQGKFQVTMFKFIGDYTYVYLHCQVSLCAGKCEPSCSGRAAANVPEIRGSLSVGPIRIADSGTDSVGKASGLSVITMIGLVLINKIFL